MTLALVDQDFRPPRRRMSWEERSKEAHRQFPSIDDLDWYEAFGGPGEEFTPLFVRLMGDILNTYVGREERGKSGPRPQVNFAEGMRRLRQFAGKDVTTLPFHEALSMLVDWKPNGAGRQAGRLSLTSLARKTHLSRSKCYRLLNGIEHPTADEMERIAKAFSKQPSFFAEWRKGYVLAALASKLEEQPDSTIAYYRALTRSGDE